MYIFAIENANDALKGRVMEFSLADLNKDDEQAFRKIKLRVDEVQGKNCLTSFYGMDFTSDKLRSLVRKWQTLIEAHVDVRTTDGYLLRLFAIGFTKKRPNQVKKTTYAKSSQVKEIRKKMFEIMTRESTSCDLKELVQVLANQHCKMLRILKSCPLPETHPRGNGEGDRESSPRHLPLTKRLHPQSQDPQISSFRYWQAA